MTKDSTKALKPSSKADWWLLIIVIVLLVSGVVFVFDASVVESFVNFGDKFHFAKNQLLWATVGLITLLVMARIPLSLIYKASKPLFILSLILLIAVVIPGIGTKVQGARRWLSFGFLNIQPSELIKLTSILYFPTWLTPKPRLKPFLGLTGFIMLLLMLEPDLGTTVVIAGVAFTLFFVAKAPLKQVFSIAIVGLLIGALLIISSPYRRQRLNTFIDPTSDPLGSSYHIRQVLISLGSGGVTGTGFGRSRQKYQYLPESTTDSIFAVIAEETGFLGASVIIGLFILFIIRSSIIIRNIGPPYPQLLAVGVVGWISIQTLLNLGAMVSIIPLTGVPLPFISYGGSSLVTILAATGLLLNASRYRKQ